jgi:hypothetical protein
MVYVNDYKVCIMLRTSDWISNISWTKSLSSAARWILIQRFMTGVSNGGSELCPGSLCFTALLIRAALCGE